jgi:hypothetical protein
MFANRVDLKALLVVLAASVPAAGQDRGEPATVAEAASKLNLETFPRMEGAEEDSPRRVASLSYSVRSGLEAAFKFQAAELAKLGWKEQPGTYVSEMAASATYTSGGFGLSVAVVPTGEEGVVDVTINQLGNVDLARLPLPPGSKPLYSGPASAIFVHDGPAEKVREAAREELLKAGWEPYGEGDPLMMFKKNAVRLTLMVSPAPAQGGKTTLSVSTELMSADLPAPPAAKGAHYADTTTSLSFGTTEPPAAVFDFYRSALAARGMKPTTENPVKDRFEQFLIFTTKDREMIEVEIREGDETNQAQVTHRTPAEVAELDRKGKAEADRRAKMAGQPKPAAERLEISLPKGARIVEAKPDAVQVEVPNGSARAAVIALRDRLVRDGWKLDAGEFQPMAGAAALSKPGATVTLSYTDTGFLQAEVSVSATGVEIVAKVEGAN